MSKERFIVRQNKYENWEVWDTEQQKPVHVAVEKEYADSTALYFNADSEPLSKEEAEAMWVYRKGEEVKND